MGDTMYCFRCAGSNPCTVSAASFPMHLQVFTSHGQCTPNCRENGMAYRITQIDFNRFLAYLTLSLCKFCSSPSAIGKEAS